MNGTSYIVVYILTKLQRDDSFGRDTNNKLIFFCQGNLANLYIAALHIE